MVEGIIRRSCPFGAFAGYRRRGWTYPHQRSPTTTIGFGEKAVESTSGRAARHSPRAEVHLENNRISPRPQAGPGRSVATAATALTGAEVTGKVTKLFEFGVPGSRGRCRARAISEIDASVSAKSRMPSRSTRSSACKILKIDPQPPHQPSIKASPLPEVKIQEGRPQQGQAGEARGRGRDGPGGWEAGLAAAVVGLWRWSRAIPCTVEEIKETPVPATHARTVQEDWVQGRLG